jgi:hypothetical protein
VGGRIGWWLADIADIGGGDGWRVSISGRDIRVLGWGIRVLGRGIGEVRRWVDDLRCR